MLEKFSLCDLSDIVSNRQLANVLLFVLRVREGDTNLFTCLCWLNRSPFACVYGFMFREGNFGNRMRMCMFGCCTCSTQFFFTLFRARFSSNYASNTVHERFECVFVFGCGFSVNFNVDMYLVLRSPISRR